MQKRMLGLVLAGSLWAASSAPSTAFGQIIGGNLTVTGAEMHWWAGVARDATARLYDVDEDTCVLHVRNIADRYDQGIVEFHARQGKGVELEKMHESIWATRLSRGTRSGAVCLEITALGTIAREGDELVLRVNDSEQVFVLVDAVDARPPDVKQGKLPELQQALDGGATVVGVTGYVDGWRGNWPVVLRKSPAKRPRLMVVGFQTSGDKTE